MSAAPLPRSRPDPPDQGTEREAARVAALEACRAAVTALTRRRDFNGARLLVEQAMDRGDLNLEDAGRLLDLLSSAVTAELSRLKRGARRGPGDEAEAVAGLDAARALLGSRLGPSLGPEQRERIARRLWRGHARLGLRRWRAGDFEAAVDALFLALSAPVSDPRRRRLTCDLLVRTLEDMAGQALELIPQPLGDGDRAAALGQTQRLLVHLRRARDEGISPEDLAVAASRARQLLEHIEQAPVR